MLNSSTNNVIARLLRAVIAMVGVAAVLAATPTSSSGQGELVVKHLDVSPVNIRSGETVRVDAILENRGDIAIHNLRVGTAVAGATSSDKSWKLLEQEPDGRIGPLQPNEELPFQATVRLEGDGWFQVGISGVAANAMLRPQGRSVHVFVPTISLIQMAILLGVYVILISAAALVVRMNIRAGRLVQQRPVTWWTSGAGVIFMIMGLGSFWKLSGSYSGWWVVTGVVVFVVGWVLAGSNVLSPVARLQGVLASLALYILVGTGWMITVWAGLFGRRVTDLVGLIASEPDEALVILYWPLQVAQTLGI